MTEVLKSCPFCGTAASVHGGGDGWTVFIECPNEGCAVKPSTSAATREPTIAAWNRRALEPPPVVAGREEMMAIVEGAMLRARAMDPLDMHAWAFTRHKTVDAIISLLGGQGDSSSRASPSPPDAARHGSDETSEPSAAWRPIESAPRDGAPILLLSVAYTTDADAWSPEIHHGAAVAIGKWNPDGTSWVDRHGSLEGAAERLQVTGTWSSDGGWFQPNEVTHWQPLPEPPQ